jgi:DHA2 family multidrug resistance protein-like MFS transporter
VNDVSPRFGAGLPIGRRRLVVATVAITTILGILDGTISNVALPTIAQDLRASSAAVVWVVNAFQLATTILLLPLSSYGDIVGFARVYRAGVAILVVASVFCATAHDLPTLIAARTFQGIGAAAILASSQPISRFSFPIAMLGVAIGIQSVISSTSQAAGPSIGGLILGIGSWRWLYWINVPFGAIALALSGLLPRMPRGSHPFDWPSAALSGATLALFITGLDELRAPANVALFALETGAAAILGTVAVRRQRSLDPPFLAVDLLRIRVIRLALAAGFTGFVAQGAALIALPFFFRSLGYTAAETGFMLSAFPVGAALISLIAGRLADRYHTGILGAIGLATFAASMAMLALLPAHPAAFDVVWRTALAGIGWGIFASPNLRTIVGAAPPHRVGVTTGLTTTSRLTGSTIGVALTALVFSAAGTAGNALWLAAAIAAAGTAICTLRIGAPRGVSDP